MSKGSTVSLVVGLDQKEIRQPTLQGGLPIPAPHEWFCSSGVSLVDPDYLRARELAARGLKRWFTRKFAQPIGRFEKKKAFNARAPFWAHVLADYALWSRVDDDARPATWPKNTTQFAQFHQITVGELSQFMHRVKFKWFIEQVFPPIPYHLFIGKLDKMVMKHALREELWQKSPDKAKALAELAYKRYNIIKSGSGGIQITNTNAQASEKEMREVPNEAALAKALALVAPYMPRLAEVVEVPSAEETDRAAGEVEESRDGGGEPDPAGDGQT